MPVGSHLVFRAENQRVLATTPNRQRAFASAMCQIGERHGLYSFGLGDTHAHGAFTTLPNESGRLIHDARLALGAALEVRIAAPSLFPIEEGRHAQRLISYVHSQDVHHGAGLDPWREGTSLPDLLGLRIAAPWLVERVRAIAPRLRRRDLWREWGCEELESVALPLLAESAAAAGFATSEVAEALGLTLRAVQRLRLRPAAPELVRAIRLQRGLRSQAVGESMLREQRNFWYEVGDRGPRAAGGP